MTMPQRLAEARKLMQAAGYGPRNPLPVVMRYDSQDKNNNVVVAVRAMWRSVGANMEMVNSDFGAVIADARSGNYESALYAWFAAFNDASTFLGTLDSTNRSTNFARYQNEEFDALMAEASASADLEERRELMQQAERVAMEDHALIPVFFYAGQRLVSPVVQGWVDNPRAANLTRYLSIQR
ncbi:MAG: peptide ABC transporter substrate-binding protein, partial [Gammaproteobacteria bacterium]|nr:peptide ABC transporter substrate-binding protein [Gammaproteobacteria bacterium]